MSSIFFRTDWVCAMEHIPGEFHTVSVDLDTALSSSLTQVTILQCAAVRVSYSQVIYIEFSRPVLRSH